MFGDWEEQVSSVQQDLGGCLLVVGLPGEVPWLIFEFLHWEDLAWLVSMLTVQDSWKVGPGDLSVSWTRANSIFVSPLKLTCVFLIVAALRINWDGVIWDKLVLSRFFEAVSTSAQRNFLNNRTPISARFGHGVRGPVGSLFTLCIRKKLACHVDDGKPYLHKSPSDSSETCPFIHEV